MSFLDQLETALEDEGIDVIETDEHPDEDRIGFVSIYTTIEIEGEPFEGEVMYFVYVDGIEPHGADIWQTTAHVREDSDREALLERVSRIRDGQLGDAVWTYHQREEVEDNMDEITADVKAAFAAAQATSET